LPPMGSSGVSARRTHLCRVGVRRYCTCPRSFCHVLLPGPRVKPRKPPLHDPASIPRLVPDQPRVTPPIPGCLVEDGSICRIVDARCNGGVGDRSFGPWRRRGPRGRAVGVRQRQYSLPPRPAIGIDRGSRRWEHPGRAPRRPPRGGYRFGTIRQSRRASRMVSDPRPGIVHPLECRFATGHRDPPFAGGRIRR